MVAEWAEMMVEWKALSWVALTAAQLVAAMVWERESERVGGTAFWMVGGWAAAMAWQLVALIVRAVASVGSSAVD